MPKKNKIKFNNYVEELLYNIALKPQSYVLKDMSDRLIGDAMLVAETIVGKLKNPSKKILEIANGFIASAKLDSLNKEIENELTNSISKESKHFNTELRERSGEININSKLVGFLYELMRDHLPAGEVEKLVRKCQDPEIEYCNGYLAKYAEDLANRLK